MSARTNEKNEIQQRASRTKARTLRRKLRTEPLMKDILRQSQAELLACHFAYPLRGFKAQQHPALLSIYTLRTTLPLHSQKLTSFREDVLQLCRLFLSHSSI